MTSFSPAALLCLASALAAPLFAQATPNVVFRDDGTSQATQIAADTRVQIWFDHDGDGDKDLLAVNFDQNKQLYENAGGVLVLDNVTPGALLGAEPAKGVDVGDLDNDGDLDVFIANAAGASNAVYLNAGGAQAGVQGSFLAPLLFNANETAHAYDVSLGDLDGDGNLDAVVVNRFENNQLYFGLGDGTFLLDAASPVGDASDGSRAVELADLDGDGDLDIVIANSNGADNEIFVNLGGVQGGTQGEFVELTLDEFVTDGGDSYGVRVGDLNGDMKPDLVVANRDEANAIYQNVTVNGDPVFERVIVPGFDPNGDPGTFGDSYDIAIGDLDGNGGMDLVIANRVMNNFVFMDAGNGQPFDYLIVDHGQAVMDRGDSRAVTLHDIDGDGFPELSVANTLGGTNFQYENLGAQWTDLGNALPGSMGVPSLVGQGDLAATELVGVNYTDGAPNAPGAVLLGLGTLLAPFKGGVIVPTIDFQVPVTTDAQGELAFAAPYPAGLPTGFNFFFQVLTQDAGAPQGIAFSNAVRSTGL